MDGNNEVLQDVLKSVAKTGIEIPEVVINENEGHEEKFKRTYSLDAQKLNDCLIQIVREWTVRGEQERKDCFEPVLNELLTHFPDEENRSEVSVLVPGCGLARLPFEIAKRGFNTLGNEKDFFQQVISWYKEFQFAKKLKMYRIIPGSTIFIDRLYHALRASTGGRGKPSIDCKEKKNQEGKNEVQLQKVALCFNITSLEPTDCGNLYGGSRGACPKFFEITPNWYLVRYIARIQVSDEVTQKLPHRFMHESLQVKTKEPRLAAACSAMVLVTWLPEISATNELIPASEMVEKIVNETLREHYGATNDAVLIINNLKMFKLDKK